MTIGSLYHLFYILVIIILALEIRRLRQDIFTLRGLFERNLQISESLVDEWRDLKTSIVESQNHIKNLYSFKGEVEDYIVSQADHPGTTAELLLVRERQGILEENQEFEYADVQRRLAQVDQRIISIRSVVLRIDAELGRHSYSDDIATL